MTERLYYREPARREFEAVVAGVAEADGRVLVRLDRTAFYPTSGGQPFDTGTLGGMKVVEVVDETDGPDGDVLHVVVGGTLAAGQRVEGRIDWPRRFEHMQQHTGQHVLSAAFDTLFDVATVSFHMGAEVSTIDLARDVSLDQLAVAENEANRIVWEDRPVTIRFASDDEVAQLPLRKPPKKSGIIRLIDIDGCDLSACGGTHVDRTGAVGIIAISGWERFKGGTRVEFVCGSRALARFRSLRDTASAAARVLSAAIDELPRAVGRLSDEAKEQRRALGLLQGELAKFRAAEMAGQAEPVGAGRLVMRAVDADAAGLKSLASAVAAHGVAVVLVSTAAPALIVITSAPPLEFRANDVLGALTAKFGGRGGGKADLAQGGGLNAPPDAILAEARRLITSA